MVDGLHLVHLTKNEKNECNFTIKVNDNLNIDFYLNGNDPDVRKVTYNIEYEGAAIKYHYNLYD